MRQIKLKINKPLLDRPIGSVITLKVDDRGIIIDPFWRGRLKDAAKDGCVEVVNLADNLPTFSSGYKRKKEEKKIDNYLPKEMESTDDNN